MDLEKYMLTAENIAKIPRVNSTYNPNKIIENNKTSKNIKQDNSKIMSIKTESANISIVSDKLFWCFYIILNGEHEFDMDHSYKREKEFKIESIEKLRKIKSQLKAIKLRLNEIEDELLNQKKISIKSLIALSILYKINIFYIWDRKFFEIINDSEKENNVIITDGLDTKILPDINQSKLDYYKNNYWSIENVEKQLKAMTSYSKEELFVIINKLEIKDITLKNTKKQMYEKILEKL